MKIRELMTRGAALALGGMLSASAAIGSVLTGPVTVSLAAEATAEPAAIGNDRNVMLGTSGLADPSNPFGDDWVGNYVYFGNVGNYPICFRVLDKDSNDFGGTSLLLDSNYGILRKSYSASGSGDWESSDIRKYLNNEFLMGNFSEAERNAILASSKGGSLNGDKIFLLNAEEATDAKYGYAAGGAIAKENMKVDVEMADWMLRSDASGTKAVDGSGQITGTDASQLAYIAPAVNVSADKIMFTYAADESKSSYFAPTTAATDAYLKLTLEGGNGFSASRKDNDNSPVPAGYGFMVDVNDLGTPQSGVNYSQISGILKDSSGNVASYGLLSNVAATGEVLVPVPASTPAGDYTLCVFAEDVQSDHYDHATDYASNFAEIPITITDPNVVDQAAQESAQAAQAASVEKVEEKKNPGKKAEEAAPAAAQTQKTEAVKTPAAATKTDNTQQKKAEAPKAVAHTVKLEGENGTVTASSTSATVGTVIVLNASPKEGYHFKEWKSGEVSVASDNKFTMPDKDVTVKAIFEKNNNNHAIILDYMERGTVSLSATNAVKDTEITIQANPAAGFHFLKWEVTGLPQAIQNEYKVKFRMPDNDVKLRAIFEKDETKKYNIYIKTVGNGNAIASEYSAYPNTWITLNAAAAAGYRFVRWESWEVNPGGQNKFLMPNKDVTVTAVFEQIEENNYSVSTVVKGEGGVVWTIDENGNNRTAFKKGEKVFIRYDKGSDVSFDSLRADNVDFSIETGTNREFFYMPDRNVTVTAIFSKPQPEPEKVSYKVDTKVTGNGAAWTTDANGSAKSSFNEGETVYVQWNTSGSELAGVETDIGGTTQDQNTRAYYFTMPARNLNVYVKFNDPEPSHRVYLNVDGDGEAWITDAGGKGSDTFMKGEAVRLEYSAGNAELSSVTADGANIYQMGGYYGFDMPGNDVSVYVKFKAKEPEIKTRSVDVKVTKGTGTVKVLNEKNEASSFFKPGDKVSISCTGGEAGVESVEVTGENKQKVEVKTTTTNSLYSFIMPDQNVSITVAFAEGKQYKVTTSVTGNGTVFVSDRNGNVDDTHKAGEYAMINCISNEAEVENIVSTGGKITKLDEERYLLEMPANDVVVYVTFKEYQPIVVEPDPVVVPAVVTAGQNVATNYEDTKPQADQAAVDEPKADDQKADEPKAEEPAAAEPKQEEPQADSQPEAQPEGGESAEGGEQAGGEGGEAAGG